ncbi:MAG TPA: HD domain-containing protein [Ignavibacteriales bacterium]|nr:HD domain-containing protein [Ignavibacteriales bacterium]
MLNQKKLSELIKDEEIDNFYLLVKKCERRLNKNEKPYYYFELADKTTSIVANYWNNFNDTEMSEIKTGDVVYVKGKIIEFANVLQITITKLTKTDTYKPEDFVEKSKRDLTEMLDELNKYYHSIRNINLKKLLGNLIFDNQAIFQKYIISPAGKAWHHAYIHGLLEHTLEIIKICDLICSFHNNINRDLLITGAILHDFGKIYEISSEPGFLYTDEGKLIGHIVISAIEVDKEIQKIKDFPKDLRDQVIHLILSHQGKLEHASPVVPKTIEAITLYHADELSAKVNAYKQAIENNIITNNWTKNIPLAGTDLYYSDSIYTYSENENNRENNYPKDNKTETLDTLF